MDGDYLGVISANGMLYTDLRTHLGVLQEASGGAVLAKLQEKMVGFAWSELMASISVHQAALSHSSVGMRSTHTKSEINLLDAVHMRD